MTPRRPTHCFVMPAHAYPRTLAGVPLLIAEPERWSGPAPLVLWHHGFQADALAHAGELERCAEAGFLAVGVDAVGHGARSDPDRAARIASAPGAAMEIMLDCAELTVGELPALLRALTESYRVDGSRISMVGISMGAFLTYKAIAAGLPLRAAVALLGSPDWSPRARSPHLEPEAFRRVALLSVTAEHDVSVSPAATAALHTALMENAQPASFHPHYHFVLRGAGHLTTAEEWQRAIRVTMQWLEHWGAEADA
jgi:uncharacterized protein